MALKEEEAAVYDRQLRVWGVEVQRKLTAAKVLIVGFGKLAAEISKNITLAGVGQVSLLDDTPASQLEANFLITEATAAGQTAAEAAAKNLQAMNPLVKVTAVPGSTSDVCSSSAPPAAAELVQQQDLVIGTSGLSLVQVQQLDELCRQAGVKFMATAAAGPSGWFFVDLQKHSYTPKGDQAKQQVLSYSSFSQAMSVDQSQLTASTHPMYHVLRACLAVEKDLQRQLEAGDLPAVQQQLQSSASSSPHLAVAEQLLNTTLSHAAAEFAPVCAVLGGIVANNVVAAVSGSSAPLNNLLYYTLIDSRAIVETQPQAAATTEGKAAAVAAAHHASKADADTVEID